MLQFFHISSVLRHPAPDDDLVKGLSIPPLAQFLVVRPVTPACVIHLHIPP